MDEQFSYEGLYRLLEERRAKRPEGSYTTYLFEKGREKILKKVGEECTEVIIGAMKGSREETIYEISDLCYHVLVLMVAEGITLDDPTINEVTAIDDMQTVESDSPSFAQTSSLAPEGRVFGAGD